MTSSIQKAQKDYSAKWREMSQSRHFPIFHYVPGNWINDPKLFYWQGEYHIFFQHNPNGSFWGTMHWGHTKSRDLVHWEPLPIALTPTPNSCDEDGCFTGDVIEENGRFHILYTSIKDKGEFIQTQSLASSHDLIHWDKSKANPLTIEHPEGYGGCWRDPCVWKEGDDWLMAIGGEKIEEQGGVVFLYSSQDLTNWRYRGELCEGSAEDVKAISETALGAKWYECPDFFPLDGKHVLLTTHAPHTFWQVGKYDNHQFVKEQLGTMDGGGFCSAKTLLDDQGRRIAWGFIWPEWGFIFEQGLKQEEYGFSGVLSLPRKLSVLPDGALGIEPVEELKSLRGEHKHFQNLSVDAQENIERLLLEGITGDALELLIEFEPCGAEVFGVSVRCSREFEEVLDIGFDSQTQKLVDAPLKLNAGEALKLRVYVDHSVIEVFANGRACQTLLTYPEREDAQHIALFAKGGQVKIKSLEVWEMKGIGVTKQG